MSDRNIPSKDESDFEAWWDARQRASFLVAAGPDTPFRKGWGSSYKPDARAAWLAARSSGETTVEPASVLAWAVRSFGPIALNRDERAARMAEEAVEVAQVEGVPLDVMQRITARVYSRP